MDYEIDLSDAILLQDGARGIYLPRDFATMCDRACVSGVDPEAWSILADGPDHDLYWDAWDEVLNSATLTDFNGKRYCLWQDGDLWATPIEDAPAEDDGDCDRLD